MDKSNVSEDAQLRSFCLSQAVQANLVPNGWPASVIKEARGYYLFMVGKDPIVDRLVMRGQEPSMCTLEELMAAIEEEHPTELDNLVYLSDYRRDEEIDDDDEADDYA